MAGVATVGGHSLIEVALFVTIVAHEGRAVQVPVHACIEGHWPVTVLTTRLIDGNPLLQPFACLATDPLDGGSVAVDANVASIVKRLTQV